MSFGAVIGCPKMYCLSYTAYFHNLDAVCMSVRACFHLFVCMCSGAVCSCLRVCLCVCVLLYVCRHAPEFRGTDSFDSYTCQWPDPGDNPCCRHKAVRKAPIPPPDTGPVYVRSQGVEGWEEGEWGVVGRQPPAILHNTLSSFHPTST